MRVFPLSGLKAFYQVSYHISFKEIATNHSVVSSNSSNLSILGGHGAVSPVLLTVGIHLGNPFGHVTHIFSLHISHGSVTVAGNCLHLNHSNNFFRGQLSITVCTYNKAPTVPTVSTVFTLRSG